MREQERFPAAGPHLQRYARSFDVTEISTSAYRTHRFETYQKWADATPAGFLFAVKLPQALTHGATLCLDDSSLQCFLQSVAGLGTKLKVILAQLPPGLAFSEQEVRKFFGALRERLDPGASLACEPRHASWADPVVDQVLEALQVARVGADPPRWDGNERPGGNKRIAYFRWHGAPRTYYSNYTKDRLLEFQLWAQSAAKTAREVWCIFDNTAHGHAIANALDFA